MRNSDREAMRQVRLAQRAALEAEIEIPVVKAWHIGTGWGKDEHPNCGCGRAPCGLVDSAQINPSCRHHGMRGQPLYTAHAAETCQTQKESK